MTLGPVWDQELAAKVSQLLDDKIREILQEKFVAHFPEIFRSIKTAIVEYFDERYVALSETVVAATIAGAGVGSCRSQSI